tara:strand:- start:984 stop:1226 length:243 start_codon:yes stop_codon:yes gene_type:complete
MNQKNEYQRYKKESIITNSLVTLLFGMVPGLIFLIIQAVNLAGIEITANEYLIYLIVSLIFGGFGNTLRLNNKYRKKQNL